ncbi:MAG: hypothetical protein E7596_07625 [Ruminococcaceae bacterium]|nr:hypothetical protein [Oscillospiraceae bacterium]
MAEWQKSNLNSETLLWSLYQEGLSYQDSIGLRHTIPTSIDFYEGRQWPPATESTKNLPRPVINVVKMICRSKKSSILSTPVKILYKSYDSQADMDKLNSFAEFIQNELNQEGLDKLAVDDGIKKGSYFFHYYWDKDAISQFGRLEGGVRCEIIDPLNIFFANPRELNEQKQKWILISSHVDAPFIYEICDREQQSTLKALQNSDSLANGTEKKGKTTLLTRYFRINGEVWCERATRYAIVNKPFKLSPSKDYLELLKSDQQQTVLSAQVEKHTANSCKVDYLSKYNKKVCAVASLYPIVCGYYDKREGSIYGISEVEGLIPNQKAINFNIAMSLLNAQQCAWGKYIALPNALKGQKITNSPGQVLIDHSGTGNGIKRMGEESLSSVPVSVSETLMELTRTFTGSSELLSSETIGSNMSGVAIAQLQAQAEVPIEELRSNFIEVKKKQGLVLAQFIRLYYFDKEFIRKTRDKCGRECEICDQFSSKEYENTIFDVMVEATRGSKASITSDINLLNTCLQSGKISLETYIKAYPEGAISNKSSILKQIEAEKNSEIEQLRKELERCKNGKTLDPVSII